MLEKLYQLILPPDLRDQTQDFRVSRFLVLTAVLSTFIPMVAAPMHWVYGEPLMAAILLMGAVYHGSIVALPRLTHSLAITSGLSLLGHILLLLALIFAFYPERAIFYVWFPYVILMTTVSLGQRWGAIVAGILVLLVWQIESMADFPLAQIGSGSPNPYALAISFSLAAFMTGIVAWLIEFTHRAAEQRIFASEQKLRLHVEQTPLAVITCALDGVISEWNPGAERLFGYPHDEAVGRSLESLIALRATDTATPVDHPVHGSILNTGFWRADHDKDYPHPIYRNRTKNGQEVFCEWINTPLVATNGTTVGMTSLVIDVGERIRAEEAIRASEARFRRLTTQSPDTILIYDWTVKRIVDINRKEFVDYPNFRHETISLADILTYIVPEDRATVYMRWRKLEFTPEGQDIHPHEFRIFTANGNIEWIRSRETVIMRNSQGLPTQLLATLTVITQEKNHEEELRRAKEEAEGLAEARSRFLANMSHEIRTPMNGIMGMTNLLMNTEISDEQRDFIQTIRISSESLLTIINDILDFSKIESERMELKIQPFEVRECVEDTLDLLAPQASSKGLELGYWIDPDVPPLLMGDVTRLRQILVNLVGNAVKFTERGEVWVTVARQSQPESASMLQFAVRDTGIGIPQDEAARLFSAFTQLDNSTTRRHGGTGLGLAISRRLTELMGGQMWVESAVGAGSTFFFTLPEHPAPNAAPEPHSALTAALRHRTLLIVAAAPSLQRLLSDHSHLWGMHNRAVGSAAATHELLTDGFTWDAAVISIDLPDQGGLSLARALLAQPTAQDKPIILLATRKHLNIRRLADEVGIHACLFKPLKPNELLAALTLAFGSPPPPLHAPRRDNIFDQMPHDGQPLSILLAEDNMVNQKVTLLTLNRLGYRVDVAASGLEVLGAFRRQAYDIVLMDIHMPDMDGIEATRRLLAERAPGQQPYIIAITAAAMREDRERCRAAGMHNFISKPVKVEELVGILTQARAWLAERVPQ